MDLFSGTGGVSRACRQLGVAARNWELSDGVKYDLTLPGVLRAVKQEIRGGHVLAASLGPPCGSFGPAGNRWKAIRSALFPWGLPAADLTEREIVRVAEGSATMQAAFEIIKSLQRQRVPWVLEHPHASYVFKTTQMLQWLESDSVHFRVVDQCRFGSPWRKRTRLVFGNVDPLDTERLNVMCTGGGGFCGDGKRHVILQGGAGHGKDMTSLAQAYPKRVCVAMAQSLTAAGRAKLYNRDEHS